MKTGIIVSLICICIVFQFVPIGVSHHICDPILRKQYHKLTFQSIYYISLNHTLVIVESDNQYIIHGAHRDIYRVKIPASHSGKWYHDNKFYWKTNLLSGKKITRFNVFHLNHDKVVMFFTNQNKVYYGVQKHKSMILYDNQLDSEALVITNQVNDGYFIHNYTDDQIGIKDLLMAFKVTRRQKYEINVKKLDKLLYQLVVSSYDRYTANMNKANKMILYGRSLNKASTFKSLPFGYMIFNFVFLLDVLAGKVHVFHYKNIGEQYTPEKVLEFPKKTFLFGDFFDCSHYVLEDDVKQNLSDTHVSKLSALVIFGVVALVVVALFSVILLRKKKNSTSSLKFSNQQNSRFSMDRTRSRKNSAKNNSKTTSTDFK